VAPPSDKLIWSHPGPNGSQLTAGGGGSTAGGRGRLCDGITLWLVTESAVRAAASFAAESTDEREAVDGEKNGPVSKEQPDAQPVAAGPAKVGGNSPKLDDLIVFVDGVSSGPEA